MRAPPWSGHVGISRLKCRVEKRTTLTLTTVTTEEGVVSLGGDHICLKLLKRRLKTARRRNNQHLSNSPQRHKTSKEANEAKEANDARSCGTALKI